METLLISISWLSAFLIIVFIVILCCGKSKQEDTEKPPAEPGNQSGYSQTKGEDSQFRTAEFFDLKDKSKDQSVNARAGGSNRIPGIPKLPPKGEEEDAPLPAGYKARGDPGMTAPIMNVGGGGGGRTRGDPGLTAPIMNIGGGGSMSKPKMKRGPRPKRVPQPGHTCPVQPADEDPTMPVEDDMMAYKMAAKNRPSTPPPPFPRR